MMSESSEAFNTTRFNLFEKENNKHLKSEILKLPDMMDNPY